MKRNTIALILSFTALLVLSAAPAPAGTLSYQYDALNRLTGVAYPDGTEIVYTYDAAGNRLSQVVIVPVLDMDGDGALDDVDNCQSIANADQADFDTDGEGDACDPDDDNDGTLDGEDAFPLDANEQVDTDGDSIGNNADPDDDNDGYADTIDPDPLDASVVPAARVGTRSGTNPAFSLHLGATTQVTSFGLATDLPIIGDWDGDGLDNIGVYRPSNRRFYLDMNGNDLWDAGDRVTAPFGSSGDLPIAGDWDGNRIDEIGVFRPSKASFFLDYDDSGSWSAADLRLGPFGLASDLPIIGDWDGDGIDDLGVYRPAKSYFYRDIDGDGRWGAFDLGSQFGTVGDKPVIGDWNGDGIAEIGVYRPNVRGFYFDYDGNGRWNGAIDRVQIFGPAGALPFAGRW